METQSRQFVVIGLIAAGGLALAARLVQLQLLESSHLAARANHQRRYVENVPAPPGDLLDRNGRVLATTITAHSLFVVPRNIRQASIERVSQALARALALDADLISKRLQEQREKRFLWIKRRLTPEQEEAVRALDLPRDSWGFRDEYLRRYPQGSVAAHVLGTRDVDGRGRGGLEESLDEILRGHEGRRTLIRDARGRVIDLVDECDAAPRRGIDVRTTLDSILQLFVERQLDRLVTDWKPRGACALIQDPRNGEILAMASRPTFDPNDPERVSEEAWTNRTISWMYEPGSTFKPFVVAGAVGNGVLKESEQLDCGNGERRFGSRLLHDTHPNGLLSVTDVLVKSSNIGMALIGSRLTNRQLFTVISSFGFGRPTGCDLPAEKPGLLRPPKEWSSYSNASISMGQELAVTPLQLSTAHCSLANGGTLISPKLVLSTAEAPESDDGPLRRLSSSVISRATDHVVARWLVEVPMSEVVRRGTGQRARIEGYTVFGKSGTAQKPDPVAGGYSEKKYVSSFLCGAPASNPRVVVLVVVDEPAEDGSHYGGVVAAPAAAAILRQALLHLKIAPDDAKPDKKDVAAKQGL